MTDPQGATPPPPTLTEVVRAVAAHAPDVVGDDTPGWVAATALILAPTPRGPSALFIERATHPGDRWSGQMALPGGKRDPGDASLAATAARETAEEVGLHLPDPVGRLDDHRERFGRGHVATFVYALDAVLPTRPEPGEVAATVWIDLAHLLDPTNAVRHRYRGLGPFAGIRHGERTVWGLTLGILDGFARVLGLDLPRPRGPVLG
ncbi:MAG: NUDIX hydrolase [Actinomycetes bacterium]